MEGLSIAHFNQTGLIKSTPSRIRIISLKKTIQTNPVIRTLAATANALTTQKAESIQLFGDADPGILQASKMN